MVNFLEDDTFFFSPLRYLSLGFPRLFFTMRQFHDWNKEAIIEREGSDGNGLNKQACRFHSTSRSLVNPTILLSGFITYIKQTLAQDFTKKIDRVSGIRSLSVFASSTLLHHVGSNCAPVFPKVSPGGRGGGKGREGIRASCLVRWYIGVHVSLKARVTKKATIRKALKGTCFNFTFPPRNRLFVPLCRAASLLRFFFFFTFDQKDPCREENRYTVYIFDGTYIREMFIEKIFHASSLIQGMIIFLAVED